MTLAGATLGLLVSLNIFTISGLLAKLDIIPFIYPNNIICGIASVVLVLIFTFYYQGKRGEKVIKKYSHWNKKERIQGTWVTILYIVITLAVGVAGSLYKPGYLPKLSF
jgi:hypothetical protein